MTQDAVLAAQRSVHEVHVLIQAIFTEGGDSARAAIAALEPVFAEDFSMVSTGGQIVNRSQVFEMFGRAAGGRPGLSIELGEMQPLYSTGSHALLRYRETHHVAGAASSRSSSRYSTVLLEDRPEGVVWRSLHETAIG